MSKVIKPLSLYISKSIKRPLQEALIGVFGTDKIFNYRYLFELNKIKYLTYWWEGFSLMTTGAQHWEADTGNASRFYNGILGGVKIERQSTENDTFWIFDEEGRAEITTHKQLCVPARVYKAFLKMALSALPEDQLKNYERAIKILMSDAHDEKCS